MGDKLLNMKQSSGSIIIVAYMVSTCNLTISGDKMGSVRAAGGAGGGWWKACLMMQPCFILAHRKMFAR